MRSLEMPVSDELQKSPEEPDTFWISMDDLEVSSTDGHSIEISRNHDDQAESVDHEELDPLNIDLDSLTKPLPNPMLDDKLFGEISQERRGEAKRNFHRALGDRKAKAREYARQIAVQRIAISELVGYITQEIVIDDRFDAQDLALRVVHRARACRLTVPQLKSALNAIFIAGTRRRRVNGFLEEMGSSRDKFDPNKIFAKLTKSEPNGKVTVEMTPTTIHVRCFDYDDYKKLIGFDEQSSSGGRALQSIAGLESIVTAENASNNKWKEPINTRTEMASERQSYSLNDINELTIEVNGLVWLISLTYDANEITLTATGRAGGILGQVEYPARTWHLNLYTNRWRGNGISGSLNFQLPIPTLNVFARGTDLEILRPADAQATLTPFYRQPRYNEFVRDINWSRATVDHETQHQVNTMMRLVNYYGSNDASSSQNRYSLFEDLAKRRREGGADLVGIECDEADGVIRSLSVFSRARDEMIAYYRDGRDSDDIFTILTTNPLYQEAYFPHGDELKKKIIQLKREAPYIASAVADDKYLSAVRQYMVQRYQDFLGSSLKAIKKLEETYERREDIVPILMSTPAVLWPALARRTVKYQKPNPDSGIKKLELVDMVRGKL